MSTKRRAVDNGYNHHKHAWLENGEIKLMKYPAILGSSSEAMTDMNGGFSNMYETTSGERFVVDADVSKRISLRTDDYATTEGNRVLVNHGLKSTGIEPSDEVMLVTSLPVRDFFNSDGSRNEELIAGQKNSMLQPVRAVLNKTDAPKQVANIVRSDVVSEAVAAAFDYLVPAVGKPANALEAPLAVLDFGGSTFDVVTLTKDLRIRHSSSGTLPRGTMDIVDPLKALIKSRLSEMGAKIQKVPNHMVTQAMEKGEIKVTLDDNEGNRSPRVVRVRDLVLSAAAETVSEIKAFIKQKVGDFFEYEAILLVGGGSLLCKDLFQDWLDDMGHFVIMDEYANARGMLKMVSI